MAKIMCKRLNTYRTLKSCYELFINETIDHNPQCYFNFSEHNLIRRLFSVTRNFNDNNDNNIQSSIGNNLKEIFRYKDTNISNWIVETKVQTLCCSYQNFTKKEKQEFLLQLAVHYTVNHDYICQLSKKLGCIETSNQRELIARERSLKNALTPHYQWLFVLMGRLEYGVKFLVDLRTDVLELLSENKNLENTIVIQQLNITLHDLLLLWFSVGFLHLERITWHSSCEMLQKISDYEAIHPIKNWLDLKRRVGHYRRCFVFTHPSMPHEPLVVLHTALCDLIPETVKGIEEAEKRMSKTNDSRIRENVSEIKAAIFYSIASTQKGLKGIDLGNYIIKEVAKEVRREFPMIDQLSSLSPIPKFRAWIFERLKMDQMNVFTNLEEKMFKNIVGCHSVKYGLEKLLNNSLWTHNDEIARLLKDPLTRLCAWYLYREKRRNYALNTVANFHLRNGAIMWRINWMADPSPRGVENSCGIMVNYRYIPNETEENSRNYIENNTIKASDSVIRLANEADALRK